MEKRYIPLFILSFLLTFNISVLADEGHNHENKIKNAAENFRNGKTEGSTEHSDGGQDDSHHDDESSHDGEESSHGDGDNHQDGGNTHDDNVSHEEEESGHEDGTHDEEGSGHDDGSSHEEGSSHSDGGDHGESGGHDEEAIVEPGPDYKVLGAFGTVNLAFLIIGIWNKWFRRKGE